MDQTQIVEILKQALTLHKTGQFAEARSLYREVLVQDSENYLAMYFCGLACIDLSETESALNYLIEACQLNPSKEYLSVLADLYLRLNRYKEAAESYKKILLIDNSNTQIWLKLANASYCDKNPLEAINSFKKILTIEPCSPEIYYNLGVIYGEQNQIAEALSAYESAVHIKPNYSEAYFNMGCLYQNILKDYDKALNCYLNAEGQGFKSPNLFLNIGNIYLDINKADTSIDYFKKAIELNPNYAEAFHGLGTVFYKIRNIDEAVKCYNKALNLKPQLGCVYNNLGVVYYKDFKDILTAQSYFEKGIEINPKDSECCYNLATTYLTQCYFEKGWKLYEHRFSAGAEAPKLLTFSQPKWNGEDLNGKTLYVYCEQGFGDTLMFSRYLHSLSSKGINVIFRPQNGLINLFKGNSLGAKIIDDVPASPSVDFDYQTPLLSLPVFLKANKENLPFNGGKYLNPDQDKVQEYKDKYFNNKLFKVGLFWQGNPSGVNDRAIPLCTLQKLFYISGIKFYSFQKGFGLEQLKNIPNSTDIVDLGSTFNDFSDTAAALENLDLLISIDTSILHLAGAMGKKTWLMLAWSSEWRWMQEPDSTMWYKSVRLYRQPKPGDWDAVVQKISSDLRKMLN